MFLCLAITLGIFFSIVGTLFLLNDKENTKEHAETSSYRIALNCSIWTIATVQNPSSDGCLYSVYKMNASTFGTHMSWGTKLAFSNFYPSRCGGVMLPPTAVGRSINCYGYTPEDPLVRISAVVERNSALIYYAVTAFVISALWFAVCVMRIVLACRQQPRADMLDDYDDDVLEGERAARRARLTAILSGNDDVEMRARTLPYNKDDVPRVDEGWLATAAYTSTYARDALHAFAELAVQRTKNPDTASVRSTASSGRRRNADGDSGNFSMTACCVCWDEDRDELVLFACLHALCDTCAAEVAALRHRTQGLMACPLCRAKALPEELRRMHIIADCDAVDSAIALVQAQLAVDDADPPPATVARSAAVLSTAESPVRRDADAFVVAVPLDAPTDGAHDAVADTPNNVADADDIAVAVNISHASTDSADVRRPSAVTVETGDAASSDSPPRDAHAEKPCCDDGADSEQPTVAA